MAPPTFNALIPELYCSDIARSLSFYTDILEFTVTYERPDDRFAFLEREGAQLMLEQYTEGDRSWLAGPLEHPYGRGVNFEIGVSNVDALFARVRASGAPTLLPLEDKWYRVGDVERGNRQFIVLDPDGYLLRFAEDLGPREG